MQKSNTESVHKKERVAADLIKPPAGVSRPANLREEMGSLVGGGEMLGAVSIETPHFPLLPSNPEHGQNECGTDALSPGWMSLLLTWSICPQFQLSHVSYMWCLTSLEARPL